MLKPILISLVVITITKAQTNKKSTSMFDSDLLVLNDESCVTIHNGIKVNGSCMSVKNCPTVLDNVLKRIYDHKVCGYDGLTQIVCCPNPNEDDKFQNAVKINLAQNLKCQVADSNVSGVIKFLSDCPALTKHDVLIHTNKVCNYDICSDLVCCPEIRKSRLKMVCSNVDEPAEILRSRLLQNQECTIKELNLRGVYQQRCAFADRNPHLKPILQNVCNDDLICNNWYCCPIEDVDKFLCMATEIPRSYATLVGPKCIDTKSGRQGTCKLSNDCPNYHHTLEKCGSFCCNDFYCCPEVDDTVSQSKSIRECSSYIKYVSKAEIEVPLDIFVNNTECWAVGYAAGGIVVSPGDFPHMAVLGYESNQQFSWNCGGSLISDRYVLTAAHCLTNREFGDVKKIRLGVIDLSNDSKTADCPEEFDVARIIPYPDYNPKLVYDDIGLIELVGQVKFNFHIRPICLPISSDVPLSYESMGWGALGESREKSFKLIKVHQELFSYEECQEQYRYGINRRLNRGILNDTHICAGSKHDIQSTCAGDSGGPLLAHHKTYPKLFYIYGIISFGTACGFANSPGVYTKVFPYVEWIEEIVWSN